MLQMMLYFYNRTLKIFQKCAYYQKDIVSGIV